MLAFRMLNRRIFGVCPRGMMVNGFDGHVGRFYKKVFKPCKSVSLGNGKSFFNLSVNRRRAVGLIMAIMLSVSFAYMYLFSSLENTNLDQQYDDSSSFDSGIECNVFDGKWIWDETYPLYNASECPFAERGFNCLANGRKDRDYLKWRWRPKNCDILRFNAYGLLEYLRGKRVVFVGDSLSRTQWESLICMLMTGVEDKRTVYEVNGNEITKKIRHLCVRFSSHNFTIEFYRSVFLVNPGPAPRRAPKRIKLTLRLDKMDAISKQVIDSDVLIFNTGHWWTKTKLFEVGVYFRIGDSLKLGMPIMTALKKGLDTWASWAESNINWNRTHVFFRTFESSHWSGHNNKICKVNERPMLSTKGLERSEISNTIMEVLNNISVPVTALDVTQMTAYRSDSHVGTWSDNPSIPDCSHWCLPGLPDMWNEILFLYLLPKDSISQ